MAVIAAVGFWPTYFGPLVRGTIAQPLLIHTHATVFVGWLLLFLAQAALAATGRVKWHLRLGRAGVAYALLVIAVGVVTSVTRSTEAFAAGGARDRLLFISLGDMVVFSSFFGAAVAFRRKREIHKRLMLVAATSLLVAAVSRMSLPHPLLTLLVWWSPVLLAMGVDLARRRLIHPVYVIGLAGLATARSARSSWSERARGLRSPDGSSVRKRELARVDRFVRARVRKGNAQSFFRSEESRYD